MTSVILLLRDGWFRCAASGFSIAPVDRQNAPSGDRRQ
ncbi:hypothetical protein Rrhod_4170 [Rhodococcus rhodnii LMG 5362]|uniref:Uncharacterized protein n=1 Tax=Rhodococcus rhodnii LMG 5362 TaxID=1273125 RepID=R7WH12_9NOCA|nr:hypothetical protein Rrhod_4170 [Rhodococcus rhodnii LMG 5362]